MSSFGDGKRLGSVVNPSYKDSMDQEPLPTLGVIREKDLKDPKHVNTFSKLRTRVEKFTKAWNENPDNRDKTITVLRDLTLTKEEFVVSIKQMLERDGRIEECLSKGEQLQVNSSVLKKTAKKVDI